MEHDQLLDTLKSDQRRLPMLLLVSILLVAATFAVYHPVMRHGFVHFDDNVYVTENVHVQTGLTGKTLRWAFTTTHGFFWHPLTWLSLMVDSELHGLDPGGYHVTNLLLHGISTLLLFWALVQMTGAPWPSLWAAGLFALHPLHVESVAWIAERKDVLSTVFWMLALLFYVRYTQCHRIRDYGFSLLAFGLGLMTKSMVVTLPFVLLLLDYWPLGRAFHRQGNGAREGPDQESRRKGPETLPGWSALREKLPFFGLSVAFSIVTLMAQQRDVLLPITDALPLTTRMANALHAYIIYIYRMVWPGELAVVYPVSTGPHLWETVGAGAALAGVSLVVIAVATRRPYLFAGWFWYLGTLLPVIGLVPVGPHHIMADRYTYIPLIGLFIMLAWGTGDLLRKSRLKGILFGIAMTVVFLYVVRFTWFQINYWRDSTSLFGHALDVTAGNYLAHNNLGIALAERGEVDAAIDHFSEAIRIRDGYGDAHFNLGLALCLKGRLSEAVDHYHRALAINPYHGGAHNNLGLAYMGLGQTDRAIHHFREALRIKPDSAEVHNNLGLAFARQGQLDRAVDHYVAALRIQPDYAKAYCNIGMAMMARGEYREAIDQLSRAIQVAPGFVQARMMLSRAYWLIGEKAAALREHEAVKALNPESAKELDAWLQRSMPAGEDG